MMLGRNRLEAGILELFKLACTDGRPIVAEHLLQALEAMDAAGASDTGSVLAEAYREVAGGGFGRSADGCEGPL
ncbi:MAG: hypothetical protein RIC85_02315 [Gammaproteobacteria bacterium]